MKIRIDPLDTLYLKYLRLKVDNTCEYCGRVGYVETSHFHSRRKWITRLDDENIAGLCRGCHQYLGEHPNLHNDFFEQRLGSERFEALNVRAQIVKKRTRDDEDKIKASLKEKIKLLEEGR